MEDKRKHPRLKEKFVVLCELPKGSKLEKLEKSEDISAGGIKISVPKDAIKGDNLNVKINFFNDAIPVSASGRLVWTKGFKQAQKGGAEEEVHTAGMEFKNISEEEKQRIKDYIRSKLKKK